jgi:hypothetical protein
MLRLVLDWLDRNRHIQHPLALAPEAKWYSEALLPSCFLPQSRGDGDPKSESFTHADGVIGHFNVASRERGDAKLLPGVKQFIVVEAKLGSHLSPGTKNASNYDQAARTVACMTYMLGIAKAEARTLDRLAFYLIAPEMQVKSGIFGEPVTKPSIERKARERIGGYNGRYDEWLESKFLPTLAHMEIDMMSWEDMLKDLPQSTETQAFFEFYLQCIRFNPLRARGAV